MQHKIKLRPNEVKDFVSAASKCEFDAYNGYDAEFERYLNRFAVAV